MKKLITATCLLLVAAMMLGASTFAWFSMNRSVSASGMKVTAVADSSLVITKGALPSEDNKDSTVDFEDDTATELYCSTHSNNYTSFNTGLMYVTNPADVDSTTGRELSGKTLSYGNAVASTTRTYYVDKVVYIAGNGGAVSGQEITITLDPAATIADKNMINKAISVDFYYSTVTAAGSPQVNAANFIGTLNLADLDPVKNDYSTAKTSIKIDKADIPSVGSGAIAVLMRIYIDGALQKDANTNFVNNKAVGQIAAQSIKVAFSAKDAPSASPKA